MKTLENIGTESIPSVINDPFAKNKIVSIRVRYTPKFLDKNGEWEATGYVEFMNNNTKGEQVFKADTFDDCALKIRAFLNELK